METLSKGVGITEKSTLRVTLSTDAEPQRVKGVDAVDAPLTVNPVYVGGRSVDQSTYAPNFAVGDAAPLPVDKNTGEILIEDAKVRAGVGLPADAAASSDTGSFSMIAFLKRQAQSWTSALAGIGAPADASASSDTGSFSIISFIKRLLSVKLPVSLGQKTGSGSFPVVLASDVSLVTQNQGFNGSTWDNLRSGFTGVLSSVVGFLNTVTYGIFNSTPPTLTNGQSVALQMSADGQLLSKVSGTTTIVTATFARPADTTAYAALDSVSNSTSSPTVITLANAGRVSGASGYLTRFRLETDQSTCVARFRVHFFNASVAAINDNAPYTKLWTQRASYVGNITFAATATEGTGSTAAYTQDVTTRLGYQIPSGTSLFALIETLDAFTPASAQNFFLEVTSEQN